MEFGIFELKGYIFHSLTGILCSCVCFFCLSMWVTGSPVCLANLFLYLNCSHWHMKYPAAKCFRCRTFRFNLSSHCWKPPPQLEAGARSGLAEKVSLSTFDSVQAIKCFVIGSLFNFNYGRNVDLRFSVLRRWGCTNRMLRRQRTNERTNGSWKAVHNKTPSLNKGMSFQAYFCYVPGIHEESWPCPWSLS